MKMNSTQYRNQLGGGTEKGGIGDEGADLTFPNEIKPQGYSTVCKCKSRTKQKHPHMHTSPCKQLKINGLRLPSLE